VGVLKRIRHQECPFLIRGPRRRCRIFTRRNARSGAVNRAAGIFKVGMTAGRTFSLQVRTSTVIACWSSSWYFQVLWYDCSSADDQGEGL
jgi:hypothetical protein